MLNPSKNSFPPLFGFSAHTHSAGFRATCDFFCIFFIDREGKVIYFTLETN